MKDGAHGLSKGLAVIWDMDGVIADTAPAHYASWRQAFGHRGVSFTEEQFRLGFGRRNDAIIKGVLGADVPKDVMRAISLEKEEAFRASARRGMKALPGVLPLMSGLKKRGVKMAVASSAPMDNLRLLINVLEIGRFIQVVVCDQDVKHGKPDPEVFLVAAQRLGIGPRRCLVIEDAVAGVLGAHAAGMKCVAVTNSHPRQALKDADLVIDSLQEVDATAVLKLLESA